jgi:hypothetical protein
MIAYTEEMDIPGLLTFMDYEKAFDTVNHNFMIKCLKNKNFGKTFVTMSRPYTIRLKHVLQIMVTSVNSSN